MLVHFKRKRKELFKCGKFVLIFGFTFQKKGSSEHKMSLEFKLFDSQSIGYYLHEQTLTYKSHGRILIIHIA